MTATDKMAASHESIQVLFREFFAWATDYEMLGLPPRTYPVPLHQWTRPTSWSGPVNPRERL